MSHNLQDMKRVLARELSDDDYIGVPEMARRLALSKARCYQLLQARRIRHARFGDRAVRVRWGDIKDYVESRTIEMAEAVG